MLTDRRQGRTWTVLAVVPARGQSKGIPKKNLVPLAGRPLFLCTLDTAAQSAYIGRRGLASGPGRDRRKPGRCRLPAGGPGSW